MDRNDYIVTSKVAVMLHMTTRRVVGLCHEGKFIGAVQVGRNWKIPEESVREYMKAVGLSDSLLPCAVGNTSYIEISSECYYVDKIHEIRHASGAFSRRIGILPSAFSQAPEVAKTLDLQGVLQLCISHIASVKTGHIAPKMQRF